MVIRESKEPNVHVSALRTLIADDNPTMRKILRALVDGYRDLSVVGEAINGEEAIRRARDLQPDLIIMDLSMPVLDGLSAAGIIKHDRPGTEILMFSMHEIPDFVQAAKKLGLSGFVPKRQASSTLLPAIDAVLCHQTYFPS